jgi:hypothetical protein
MNRRSFVGSLVAMVAGWCGWRSKAGNILDNPDFETFAGFKQIRVPVGPTACFFGGPLHGLQRVVPIDLKFKPARYQERIAVNDMYVCTARYQRGPDGGLNQTYFHEDPADCAAYVHDDTYDPIPGTYDDDKERWTHDVNVFRFPADVAERATNMRAGTWIDHPFPIAGWLA